MVITIDIMKKINGAIASGSMVSLREIAKECYLDERLLESVIGEIDGPVKSMKFFFSCIERYITETQKRVKMLDECYTAIQQAQLKAKAINATKELPDPPIIW
ncbi:MAG: hypothetical protein LBR87_01670 [Synergistaceae bacterium]|jgi:hypothetical protein|nr:hypothetical protein [Synergistaceae bacterium]